MEKKLKLLILMNRVPYPARDGGAIAMRQLLKGLKHEEVEVDILAFNTKKHFIQLEKIPADFPFRDRLETVYLDASVTVWGALKNLFSNTSYNIERFISEKFSKKLENKLQATSYNIVHVEGLFMCPYIDIIRKNFKGKISYRAHNIEYIIWKRMAEASSNILKKWYLNLLWNRLKTFEQQVIQTIDLLIPITHEDETLLKQWRSDLPSYVCSTGVDPTTVTLHENFEPLSIFHLGALNWQPNREAVDWFLEVVWPLVYSKNSKIHFYIAGKDTPKKYLDLKLPNVHVVGEVEDAKEFMLSKNIMVVPLLSGSGMRIKIIEGMQLGKPIVSTRIGAEGIAVESGKEMILADTPASFAQGILDLLENPILRKNISTSSIEFINRNFDNHQLIRGLTQFYKNHIHD